MKYEVRQDIGYGLIPRKIMRNKNLSLQSKAVYSYLASFAGNTGKAFPSVSLIRAELGIAKDTFYKYTKELEEKGAIEIKQERKKGKFSKNIYYLNNEIKTPCPKSSDTTSSDTTSWDSNSNNLNSNNLNSNKNNNLQQTCKDNYKFGIDSVEIKIAKFMIKELLRIKPDSKTPKDNLKGLQPWCQHIDYMIRLDNRNPKDIVAIFRWAQENDFWTSNIRSPKKLREKWDTLEIQMQKETKGANHGNNRRNDEQDSQKFTEEDAKRAGVKSF